jgi:hypothetical protein
VNEVKIINVPIESLEDRYSADWNRWFDDYIVKNNLGGSTLTIYPTPLRDKIKEGDFLDIVGTNYFKSKQIAEICERVDCGHIPRDEKVVFLIQDGWFPIEQLAYLRDMLGCHYWKFVGIFHAGTYSKWDLTARSHMYTWGEDLENSWFKIYDKIIVGSWHHKSLLRETRKVPIHKIKIIPWHVEVPKLDITKKENIVVFPHRLNVEKQPDLFLEIIDSCNMEGWTFRLSANECKTKQEYYQLLAKSKIAVSLGLEELFGIAMVEATLLGCIPLVPDAFSYKEMYSGPCRYEDIKELKGNLARLMKGYTAFPIAYYFSDFYNENRQKDFYQQVFELMENDL